MDYEKAYNEALNRAKERKENNRNLELLNFLDELFPELKESEDERVMKELISLLKWSKSYAPSDITTDEANEMIAWVKKHNKQNPDPYNGVSFEYNNHTWGMCARDGGVDILVDKHLKGTVYMDDSNAKEMFIKALERVEEQISNGYELTDYDKNSWWEDFKLYATCTIEQKPTDKVEPKFHEGDKLISTRNPNLTYEILEVGHVNELGNLEYKVVIFANGKSDIKYLECKKVDEWAKLIEQNPTNEVESKFKVGDWVVKLNGEQFYNGSKVVQITKINGNRYYFDSKTYLKADKIRLWTLDDAKDGDVLTVTMYPEGTWIGIFKEHNGCTFSSYCFINTEGIFKLGTYNHGNGKAIHPATKEQCDILFTKMKEAGYMWDSEKKELIKIEQV